MIKDTYTYSNGEITVLWQPVKCIHSGVCLHGLPQVFNPEDQPWIKIEGASSAEILAQVVACPSGALSIDQPAIGAVLPGPTATVQVQANGPLLVRGPLTLLFHDGKTKQCEGTTALCRCGASVTKPFCDGSHQRIAFKD